jgi:hypothetical protein
VAAERAEEREAEVRDAEVMQKQSALEAALHDDVTKSAERNMKALSGHPRACSSPPLREDP